MVIHNETIVCALLFIFGTALQSPAQDSSTTISSRAEQIQAERMEKAANLTPSKPGRTEKFFDKAEDVTERVFRGSPLRAVVGSLPGSGEFSFGPLVELRSPNDDVRWTTAAVGSIRSFYAVKTSLMFPGTPGRNLSLAFDAVHSDFPRLDYFGPGTDSLESGRTNYRREFTILEFRTRWEPPRRHIAVNLVTGPLFMNVGPGKDSRFPSTETVYSPREAPGVQVQTDYVRTGGSFELDYRDIRHNPSDGMGMVLEYDRYGALDEAIFSFHRVAAAVDHYIPFLNKKRVIAMRAATVLNYHDQDQVVPFYMQPTLGGNTTLRGFHRYRFYDENSILFNAEYRWEVNTGMDMVLFGDAGRVFDRPHNVSLRHLKTSAGIGVRFKTLRNIAARFDAGFSNEGVQVWLSVASF